MITILQASRMKSQSLEMDYVYKIIFEGLKSIDLFDLLWEEEDRLVTKIQRDLGITNQNKIIYQRVKKFESMAPMAAPETYLPEHYRRPNLLSLDRILGSKF